MRTSCVQKKNNDHVLCYFPTIIPSGTQHVMRCSPCLFLMDKEQWDALENMHACLAINEVINC